MPRNPPTAAKRTVSRNQLSEGARRELHAPKRAVSGECERARRAWSRESSPPGHTRGLHCEEVPARSLTFTTGGPVLAMEGDPARPTPGAVSTPPAAQKRTGTLKGTCSCKRPRGSDHPQETGAITSQFTSLCRGAAPSPEGPEEVGPLSALGGPGTETGLGAGARRKQQLLRGFWWQTRLKLHTRASRSSGRLGGLFCPRCGRKHDGVNVQSCPLPGEDTAT